MEHDGNNEHRKIESYDKDYRQYKTIELEPQRRASLVKMLGRFEMLRVLQFPEFIILQIQTLFKAGLKYRFFIIAYDVNPSAFPMPPKTLETVFVAPWIPLPILLMIFFVP